MTKRLEETALGWLINLVFILLHAVSILVEDIDMQLKIRYGAKDGFDHEKKQMIGRYEKCLKDAYRWMLKFGLDRVTYEAVQKHSGLYSNSIATANAIIRVCMLALDRSHCEGGDARVFKRLRSLPENGLFSEKDIARFNMKFELIPEPGDRVRTDNHGDGTLLFHTMEKNWNIRLDSGEEIILNEKQFKLL